MSTLILSALGSGSGGRVGISLLRPFTPLWCFHIHSICFIFGTTHSEFEASALDENTPDFSFVYIQSVPLRVSLTYMIVGSQPFSAAVSQSRGWRPAALRLSPGSPGSPAFYRLAGRSCGCDWAAPHQA